MRSDDNSFSAWIRNFFALFTQAKSFRDNPVIGSTLLNRLGLHVVRVCLAHTFFWLRQQMLCFLISKPERQQLRRDGFLLIENVLDNGELETLTGCTRNALAGGDAGSRQGDTLTELDLITPIPQPQTEYLHAILRKPALLNRLRYASGTCLTPWYYYMRIRNAAIDGPQDPQKTPHADAFHPTMKAWLFLHAVEADGGPFCYHPGSHRLTLKRLRWEYRQSLRAGTSDNLYTSRGSFRLGNEDLHYLGLAPLRTLTVPANTLLIANTYGFHCRGPAAAGAERTSLWASAWRAPFIPFPLPDALSIRKFFDRQMRSKLR